MSVPFAECVEVVDYDALALLGVVYAADVLETMRPQDIPMRPRFGYNHADYTTTDRLTGLVFSGVMLRERWAGLGWEIHPRPSEPECQEMLARWIAGRVCHAEAEGAE